MIKILDTLEVRFTYQYLLSKIPALKIPQAFSNDSGRPVTAAVPLVPTERIKAWRRVYRVDVGFKGFDDLYPASRETPRPVRAHLFYTEAWQAR